MNSLLSRPAAFVAGALILACTAASLPSASVGPVTLGTFDSRAVAIAWFNSAAGEELMAGLHRDLAAAKAAGDEQRVAELEAHGPELQEQLHDMAFSTAPVDHLIALIEDELPAIAADAGVDAIVCKWDLAYAAPGVAFVDVTERLVAAYDPNADGLRSAREIVEQDPLPLDGMDHEH